VEPTVTHSWCLQFIIKVFARSFLHATCTSVSQLHPTCTCGTCSYSSVTLAIRHKSLRSVLSPSDVYLQYPQHLTCGIRRLTCHVYLWDHSPSRSDLWDPTTCMSCVPVGPSDLSVRMAHMSHVPVGPLYLHPTCGTWQLACHLYLLCCWGLINSKKTSMPGSRTWDLKEGMHGLYHCARCLVVLAYLWSLYSIIFSVWMPYRLTYIGYFPFKWK
jgi:hypothetical protein